MKFLKFSITLLFVGFFWSCSKDKDKTTSQNDVEVKIEADLQRFDKKLMAVKSETDLQTLFTQNPWYTKALYRAFPDEKPLVKHIYDIISNPGFKQFYTEVDSSYGDMKAIQHEFSQAFSQIKSLYPNFKAPKILTTLTGMENDIFISDSLVIISIEAFLGPKARFRPDQPNYILSRYSKEYILPIVISSLAKSFNGTSVEDQSFLADMMYYGKSLEFCSKVLPNTPKSVIMGWSEQQMENTWVAQDLVWEHMVEKSLLYEKNTSKKEKYFGERPGTPEIGPECPPRIGQWLGWRIIQRYLKENTTVTFQEMMANKNSEEILKLSAYRGQTDEEKE
ncbi:MAG: hypothetical protein ACRCVT_08305 [Leadbetterella sp.]